MKPVTDRKPPLRFAEGEARYSDHRVCFWTFGPDDAPWLVMTHGGALDHKSFRPTVEGLANDWRVLLWDMPGHGLSQPMPAAFTVAGCADALGRVMDAAGVRCAVHLGFSFGGMVAQIFAKAHPQRVNGLVAYACHTPHLLPPGGPPEAAAAMVAEMFGGLSWDAIKDRFALMCGLRGETQAGVKEVMEPLGKAGFLSMVQALLSASDYDPTFRIRGPWLSIAGAEDSNGAALWAAMDAYAAAYPLSERVLIPEAGHCAHMDQRSVFATELASRLKTFHAQVSNA